MGYTNYWEQHTGITDENWNLIKKEIDYILEHVDGIQVFENSEKSIVFNGIKEKSHEDFVLYKTKPKDSFHFCKTNMKPYDFAVWHILTFTSHLLGKNFEISRDR